MHSSRSAYVICLLHACYRELPLCPDQIAAHKSHITTEYKLTKQRFFPNLIKPNRKWDAFGRVMREKGTVLVCMIRYCPIPWAVGNGLFASIESVKLWQYMLANLYVLPTPFSWASPSPQVGAMYRDVDTSLTSRLIQPRLLIPVFIGSRLTSLSGGSSDSEDGSDEPQDPAHFWLNIFSICLSLCISSGTGIWIYRLTARQMKKYEHVPGEGDDAMDGLEEGLLAAAYADELARAGAAIGGAEGAAGAGVGRPKIGNGQGQGQAQRSASYGFGEIVRGEGYVGSYRDRETPPIDEEAEGEASSGRLGTRGNGKGPRTSPSAVGEDGVEVVGMIRRSSSNSTRG